MEKSFYAPQAFREQGSGSAFQCIGMELMPGKICQLHCEACYKNVRERVDEKRVGFHQGVCAAFSQIGMDPMIYGDVIDYAAQAKEAGFQEIALLGGEPTLHPQIVEIIRQSRLIGLRPILVTNGLRVTMPEILHSLKETHSVVVTHAYLPGEEDVIDRYSGKQGYAEKLKEAIDVLKDQEEIQLILEMPLTDSLYGHAFDFFRMCRESGIVPFIEISRSRDDGVRTTNVTPEQIEELFGRFQEYDQTHHPDLAVPAIMPPAYGNPCTMTVTGLHVKNFGLREYGGVYSCCAQKLEHGNLRRQSLQEILQSPTLSVYRDQDAYIVGPCRDCDLYSVCKGGCRGEAMLRFGCPRASSPACHRIPKEIRENAALMTPETCAGCPAECSDQCSLPDQTHVAEASH